MGKKLTSKTSACAVAANNWLWESLNYPPNRQHCSQIIVREALILKKPVKIVEILHYGGLPITDPTYKATVHTGMHTNNILWSICHAVCTVHFQVIWGSGKFGLKKAWGWPPSPLGWHCHLFFYRFFYCWDSLSWCDQTECKLKRFRVPWKGKVGRPFSCTFG